MQVLLNFHNQVLKVLVLILEWLATCDHSSLHHSKISVVMYWHYDITNW